MRRIPVLLSVVAVMLLGLLAAGGLTLTMGAQEGTPPAGDSAALPAGVSFEPIAFGLAETLPPAPALVGLARFRFAPGAALSVPADDPSLVLVSVESGALTFRITVPVVVTRAAAMATPGAQAQEEVAADSEFTLGPGDSFLGPPVSGGEIRNDGLEPAVFIGASIEPVQAAGTPDP